MATATDITKQEAQEDKRPEGIGFYNIKSGETLFSALKHCNMRNTENKAKSN